MSPSPIEVRYIGRRELLKQLGISKHTLLRWTKQRKFPAPLPGSGRTPVYDMRQVDAWLRGVAA
jgi:predicted DNA-binding transcriptional regulator AlpA